ncbi:hypothetical protein FFLO_01940 [Filobasidium floriforme]|uniref:Uncharacterized protein n=2 Tax=Filobasidium floriforme TaxID=5210 RepID=A0A8K0JNS4_9TREE|nr:hypothetical protein FFLO_01940 [Filobasidium floriforme]
MNVSERSAFDLASTLAGLSLRVPTTLETFNFDRYRWLDNETSATGPDTTASPDSSQDTDGATSEMGKQDAPDPIQDLYEEFNHQAVNFPPCSDPASWNRVVQSYRLLENAIPLNDYRRSWLNEIRVLPVFQLYSLNPSAFEVVWRRHCSSGQVINVGRASELTLCFTQLESQSQKKLTDRSKERLIAACSIVGDTKPWDSGMWELFRLMQLTRKHNEEFRKQLG